MAISWKWEHLAQKWPTRQIWGCFQRLEKFSKSGDATVCSIDFGNLLSLNPGWSSFCSSWQCWRTQLALQLCQLHHHLIRHGSGDQLYRSCSVSRWSCCLIQSRARRRGRQRDTCPPFGARTLAMASLVRSSASSWMPRHTALSQRSSTLSLSLSRDSAAEAPSPLPPRASQAPRVLISASHLASERLRVRLELLHLLHPSVGRDLPEVSRISRVCRRRVHSRRDPNSGEPRRCSVLASSLPSESR